jgi:putative membrane protein
MRAAPTAYVQEIAPAAPVLHLQSSSALPPQALQGPAMKTHLFALAAALALPAVALVDSTAHVAAADSQAKLGVDDTMIVAHIHHVNQMEIDLGKWAQKSGTSAIKGYADALVADHTSQDRDLTAFAKKHGYSTIPNDKPQTDADREAEKDMTVGIAHLKTLKGPDFDKEFLTMMTQGHDKELAKIDVSIGAANDPDLKTMLQTIKPVLQRHSDQARDLQKTPQASAASAGNVTKPSAP